MGLGLGLGLGLGSGLGSGLSLGSGWLKDAAAAMGETAAAALDVDGDVIEERVGARTAAEVVAAGQDGDESEGTIMSMSISVSVSVSEMVSTSVIL